MEELLVVRNSELSTWRECRQKWEWGWNQRLRRRDGSASALKFGTLIHSALELFYKKGKRRGGHPVKLWNKVWAEFIEAGNEDWAVLKPTKDHPEGIMASDLGREMMRAYYEEYGKDEIYEVICPEQTFQLDIDDPETGDYLGTFTGTVDAVIRDLRTGRIGFFEHKTGASLDPFGAPLIMDEQAGSYWTFGAMYLVHQGVIDSTLDLDFVLYNRLRKVLPDQRARNEQGLAVNANGSVSKNQPAPAFKREYTFRTDGDRQSVFDRVVMEMLEIKQAKQGDFFIYKNPARHCGFCEFRDMCEVHETKSDWEGVRNMTMGTWQPYEDHMEALGASDE